MPQTHVTKTRWEKGEGGDLVLINHNDPSWRTCYRHSYDFPMKADAVAALMNEAFERGMLAKEEHIREVIGA